MDIEVPQTVLRSCPIRVTGSPDLNLTGTTRAAAGTAGTAIRVSIEQSDEAAQLKKLNEPTHPREVEVCVEFANVQIRKPTIFENNGAVTPMYPNDARLRNMTYAAPIYTDIIATFTMRTPNPAGGEPTVEVRRRTLPHVHVGRIPVMVGSKYCILYDTPEKTPREMGECSEDIGGYFIVQGGERVMISQERMAENMPFVFRNNKVRNKEIEVIDVKSIGPDNEGSPKSMSVKIVCHTKNSIAPEHIRITCPRIKAEIPLFIMMRALGLRNDKEIIELICGTVDNPYSMIFQECIEDAGNVTSTEKAHEWLAANLGNGGGSRESYSTNTLQTGKPSRITTIKEVLAEECLPHIGGGSMFFEKACYIAFITKKVLDVFTGKVPHDDRDAYPNKKVELPGNLIGNLFRYLFGTKVIKDMKTTLTKEIHNGFWKSSGKIEDIINPSNVYKILKSTIVTIGMKSSLATGNFVGGKMGNKQGISQVMNRLTYLSGISHLRRVSTPIEKTGKLLAPRKLHASQYGYVCPAETPEGHAVGVVKNLSSTALVSLPMSPEPVVEFLYKAIGMKNLEDVPRSAFVNHVKIFINGAWIGIVVGTAKDICEKVESLRCAKRRGRIHIHTSINYKIERKEIWINTEGGRLIRPTLNAAAMREIKEFPLCAPEWMSGSSSKARTMTSWNDVLRWKSPGGHNLIEYIDPNETENAYIAMTLEELATAPRRMDFTHVEIHPCVALGTMASNIPFPDHNQAPRNCYQCAMGKQAMGVYALNFQERLDTMSNLLWYSSVPLASPFMSRFYRAQSMPSGFNIVVAIMTYGGYNQEDSIMINRASLERGLFRSEFYRTYKDEEKKNQASGEEERFCRPNPLTTRHMKLACYDKLGPDGIVPENTYVTQEDVLIGKVAPIRLRAADGAAIAGINHASLQAMSSVAAAAAVEAAGGKRYRDSSKLLRTNECGYVDRIYRGRNGEGYSFVKIRVREERFPVIGDKFSSRHGQKGTCGLIVAPEDMPQTRDGIIPDLIINPHCFTGETLVCQPNGVAKRIDSFSEQGLEKVLTWDEGQGVRESFSLGMENKGVRDTIRLTLVDGRTLTCTPDHKFKVHGVEGPVWKEAKDIEFSDTIIMSITGTEDKVCPKEMEWSLDTEHYIFSMNSVAERESSLAFARILGFIHTDGCISYNEARNAYTGVLYMGTLIDANSIVQDIMTITGKSPKISDSVSKTHGDVYVVYLPSQLTRSIAFLDGMTCGRRTTQQSSYPDFLFQENCPTSIIREFLGGCFGGDGWAPHINGNTFSNIAFSQSVCEEFKDSLIHRMEQFVGLMSQIGVHADIRRMRLCDFHCDSYIRNPRVSVEIHVHSNDTFRKNIGFRHCVDKLLKMEIACSYENYCAQVMKQHDVAMATVNDSMKEIRSIPTALVKVREMYENNKEKALNNYYSYLTSTLISNRRKSDRSATMRSFDYSFMESARDYIMDRECESWFKMPGEKHVYIVPRDATHIPTYSMGIMKKESWTSETVYDIGVAGPHNFISQGCIVSNCIPSRMTIAQLMETLLGKIGCVAGFLGDATPFNDKLTAPVMADILQKNYGMEPYSNEILYCGYTGKQMETAVFMGPVFYQRLKHMVNDKIHCLTPDHDVLTYNGWKPIESVTRTDRVATLQDGKIVYSYPLKTFAYDHEGAMYEIRNKDIDLKTTMNHRMWAATLRYDDTWEYGFHEAADIMGQHVRYQKDGIWEANDYQFVLPAYQHIPSQDVNMDAWLTFFGLWFAYGFMCDTINVSISVANREGGLDMLRVSILKKCLNEMGIPYSYYPITCKINIIYKPLLKYMTRVNVNVFPAWVWKLSPGQCRTFLTAMISETTLNTFSSFLANDIQQLAFHAGWSASIRRIDYESSQPVWCVRITALGNRPVVNSGFDYDTTETVSQYNGKVYCLEVPGNVFYVRRNGIPVWTGNSRATGPLVMLTRQPAEGRARDGGLRFGEMERDCLASHGTSAFLKERMMEASDNFEVHVCKGCGLIAVANKARNIWNCTGCGNTTEFSQVRIPYAYKLFLQELESMNVSSRILTETRLRALADQSER